MVYERLNRMRAWLLPHACPLCGDRAPETDFCEGCERALPCLDHSCTRCAEPFASEMPVDALCGQCQQDPPTYTVARAAFRYAPPIDRLILGAKYGQRLDWAALLGRRLARAMSQRASSVDLLVPIPLHRSRLRERGYNQSLELARPVAKALGIEIRNNMQRIRATSSQADLSREERQRNVRDAFVASQRVAGRRIAIIDDVMTSGATAEMAARCLLKAGAKNVEVWVVARA